jgi:hypothetical protein
MRKVAIKIPVGDPLLATLPSYLINNAAAISTFFSLFKSQFWSGDQKCHLVATFPRMIEKNKKERFLWQALRFLVCHPQ